VAVDGVSVRLSLDLSLSGSCVLVIEHPPRQEAGAHGSYRLGKATPSGIECVQRERTPGICPRQRAVRLFRRRTLNIGFRDPHASLLRPRMAGSLTAYVESKPAKAAAVNRLKDSGGPGFIDAGCFVVWRPAQSTVSPTASSTRWPTTPPSEGDQSWAGELRRPRQDDAEPTVRRRGVGQRRAHDDGGAAGRSRGRAGEVPARSAGPEGCKGRPGRG
jgi:hypothetical protein